MWQMLGTVSYAYNLSADRKSAWKKEPLTVYWTKVNKIKTMARKRLVDEVTS